ncbi:MAG: hypothetical protein OEM05_01665 [Myxococcales bacterium]|nr:hypothetical protein [Myxococcales bacterium]
MGKIFGILLVVIGIWVGMEVYLKGTDQALGGALAFLEDGDGTEVHDRRTTPQRAGDAARRAHDAAEARRNRLLGED